MQLKVILFILIFASQAHAEPNCQHDAKTFRCVQYERNYDGDTIQVSIPNVHPLLGNKITVRVLGVDTAEVKGHAPCERDAARTAQRLVENILKNAKVINIEDISRDKYFRVLGRVVADGQSLNDILIKNKLAYTYFGKTKEKIDWCAFTKARSTASEPTQ